MDESTFRAKLREQGYPDPVLLDLSPNTFFEDHSHKFSSFAFMLEGEFTVKTEAGTKTSRAGETFTLDSNVVHSSWAGDKGAKVLTGRKVA